MKHRLLELDAMRGIAALSIIIFHINCTYTILNYSLVQDGIKFCETGVDLFFIISGFVILLTLEKTNDWKDYAFRRFARLYPTYWLCVTITSLVLIAYYAGRQMPYAYILHNFVPNLTMLQHYFKVPDIDDVYWTLLIELLFYIFMLIIFCAKKLKNIEYICLVIMLPLFIYGSKYFQANFRGAHHFIVVALPIANYFPLFVMGITYYRMKFDKPSPFRYAVILICILCQVSLYGNGLNTDLFLSFKDFVLITIFYNLVFLLYVYDKLKFIVNKITLFIGDISYPLYLIHYYISIKVIIPVLLGFKVPLLLAASIAVAIAILLAALISRFVEKPSMRYLKARFRHNVAVPKA